MINEILKFDNIKVDPSIINEEQIEFLVKYLLNTIENNISGDVVEFGCYVGESSKFLMKTLEVSKSNKQLFVYDSFEGLPDLSEWEKKGPWKSGTLNVSEDILINNFKQNNLKLPIIHKDWFKNVPDYKVPNEICFAFLDGDFYDSIYDALSKVFDKVSDGGYICFHDYGRKDLPGVKAAISDFLNSKGLEYDVTEVCPELGVYQKNKVKGNKMPMFERENSTDITLVTGLWDIGRDQLTEGWSRNFSHYLNKFEQLLNTDCKFIIFGDEELEKFVFERRSKSDTHFILRKKEWFVNNNYFSKIQQIRTDDKWLNLSGWLKDSTQAKLEMYNPLVMSKMFLLHDAKILDPFASKNMFWIDAGLTNTVHYGYFTHDKVLNNLSKYISKFSFVCFPYEAENEIHGFEITKLNSIAGSKVNKVARAGFFGGPKNSISEINTIYYDLLMSTLNEGYMGTEESLFTIITYKYSELINYFDIESNGLFGTFFENLKNDNLIPKNEEIKSITKKIQYSQKVGLYVVTFNSPKQFETLIDSMNEYDKDLINKTKKYLLDNSSDETTFSKYSELCEKYNFEHIKKDNLGICGGRQFIAEHFNQTDLDYYLFFEDDMFFYPKKGETCRNGFNRYVDNFYSKMLEIMSIENFDFLKFNYSEFFGDNGTQWSWYNVPQTVREEFWPKNPKLPVQGLDPNAPKTVYKNVLSHKGVPYVNGEVYYSNWPQIVSRSGNKKMFLDTTWAHPYEQTWMSHMFQLVKKGELNPGLLLMTPTEHNRFEHYDRELRKES
jgi:O-methyltransferase